MEAMPDLGTDRELASYLASQGIDGSPRALRTWREEGYFEPRNAPGRPEGGRERSTVNDNDRAVALAIAQALASQERRVRLSEAAVAAWGLGAPIFHGRPDRPTEGLRGALVAEVAWMVGRAGHLLKLDQLGSRKARQVLSKFGPAEVTGAALRAALGEPVNDHATATIAFGIGTETLEEEHLAWRNPHDRGALAQARPGLQKFFEGPALLSTLAATAKVAPRAKLDADRDLSAQLFSGPLGPMWRHLAVVSDDIGPPGWAIGIQALSLAGHPPDYIDRVRQVAGLPPNAIDRLWSPPAHRQLSRGRPRKKLPQHHRGH
jgi:hypothetical protein